MCFFLKDCKTCMNFTGLIKGLREEQEKTWRNPK